MGFCPTVTLFLLEAGARAAGHEGHVVVVVDALRASATTATALAVGAAAVLPVLTVEEAATYVGRPGYRVAGERNGAKCAGFDHGNSPTELMAHAPLLAGQTLVLSTSNGTLMVNAAREGAAAIFMGTTLNARRVAVAALESARLMQRDIALVAAGEYGQYAEEDVCAARVIAAHLAALGASVPAELLREECTTTLFHATYSADELRGLGYHADLDFCARCDYFDLAPVLADGTHFVPYQPALLALP